MPDRGAPAIAYFMLMFTVNLMKKIVLETNRYARSFIKTNMQRINRCRHSRVHQWIKNGPLTINEFNAAIYNMGLNKRPTLQCYWKKGKQEYKWFRKMFPRNRFQLILKFLHVVDNRKVSGRNDPTYDPSAKFKPILDSLNMRSKYLYTPERNLSIDESLVGTRARSVMTQYIPSKSHKFGIKLWMLVESISGYLVHSTVYRGRRFDPVPGGELQSSMVVKSLLNVSCLFDKGYHVFCDSFFSSLPLASELLLNRTLMTGSLRSNRPMPQRIKNPKLSPDEYVFMRRQETLVCAYRQNKRKPVHNYYKHEMVIL
ncbi:piggyBac transposable element-derived protein 4-like [Mytilus trossulus]|uniref:piggyBac transposable element-derived protein 4-like n=1 Tax=Mytilus trossulus TaxID=6551 RepID=UPI003003E76E